jgi:hypothetical protein
LPSLLKTWEVFQNKSLGEYENPFIDMNNETLPQSAPNRRIKCRLFFRKQTAERRIKVLDCTSQKV